MSFESIINYLKENGASVLQLPERIEFVDNLPLTETGKTNKRLLKEDIKRKLIKEEKYKILMDRLSKHKSPFSPYIGKKEDE